MFYAWRDEVVTHRRRVVQLHRYFLSRLIKQREYCFGGWLSYTQRARKLRKSIGAFAFRSEFGLKKNAFDDWKRTTQDAHQMMAMRAKVCERTAFTALCMLSVTKGAVK